MYKLSLVIITTILFFACSGKKSIQTKDEQNTVRVALVTTNYGNFKLKLYNKTPLHRDNFVKLCNQNFYDSLLFHRVIKNFMIQGGDPDSKNAKPNVFLGNGGPGYTIPAEFDTSLINMRGALCAAREGDNVNPEKRSSGSQFYIVTGRKFSDRELDIMEERIDKQRRNSLINSYINNPKNIDIKNKLDSLKRIRKQNEINILVKSIEQKFDTVPKFKFSEKHRQIYKTRGGAPHLDGAYTVFGEVIEGMNVVDSISKVATNKQDRPIKDVVFSIKIIE